MARSKAGGRLEGFGEAAAQLAGLSRTTAKAVGRRALDAPAKLIGDAVAVAAPVVRGEFKPSITVTVAARRGRRRSAVERVVIWEAEDEAIAPVEFGTSDSEARPFARTAIEASKGRALGVMGEALKVETDKAVARVARKAAKAKG